MAAARSPFFASQPAQAEADFFEVLYNIFAAPRLRVIENRHTVK
jgi:hypothetical protein